MFNFQSRELETTLRSAYQQRLTGYISVTQQQNGRNTYGTLTLVEGHVVAAQFANQRGLAAFTTLLNLVQPTVSVARSSVQSERDADLPNMQEILGTATNAATPKPKVKVVKAKPQSNSSKAGFGIFPRVLMTMFFVALIPLAGFWYISNVRAKTQLEADANAKLRTTTQALTEQVNAWIDTNVKALQQNAQLPAVTSMQYDIQAPVMDSLRQAYPWSSDYSVADVNGNIIVLSDSIPITNEDGSYKYNVTDREYFKQVMSGLAVGQQVVLDKVTGVSQVCLAVPVKNAIAIQGVLIGCSSLTEITQTVADVKVGNTGFAMLADAQGQLIANGQQQEMANEVQSLSNHPVLAGSKGELVTFDQGDKKVVGLSQQTALGWTLLIQQDYNDAFATVLDSQRNAFILLAVTIVLVIVVALMLARWLAKPIQSLTAAAEDISRGQLHVEVSNTERSDEIGALARAVDRMGISLKMAMSELQERVNA